MALKGGGVVVIAESRVGVEVAHKMVGRSDVGDPVGGHVPVGNLDLGGAQLDFGHARVGAFLEIHVMDQGSRGAEVGTAVDDIARIVAAAEKSSAEV